MIGRMKIILENITHDSKEYLSKEEMQIASHLFSQCSE